MKVIRYKASDLFNLLNEEFDARDFLKVDEKIPHEYRLYDPKIPVDSSRDIKKLCERDLINISRGINDSDLTKNPDELDPGTEISSTYCKLYNAYQYLPSDKDKDNFIDDLSRVFWFIRPNIYDNRVKFHDLMRILLSSENFVESIRTISDKIKTTFSDEGGDSNKPEAHDIKQSLSRLRDLQNLTTKEIENELNTTKYKAYVLYEKSFEEGPFVRMSKIYNLKYKEKLEERGFTHLLDIAYNKIYNSKYIDYNDKEHYDQVIEEVSNKLYEAIKSMYNKEDAVKADLKATDNIYDINGKIVIPNKGLVEVKMRDYKLDSYLSEYFSIYKFSDLNPKYKKPEMVEIYNSTIDSLYKKMDLKEIDIIKDLKDSFYGIFFGEVEHEGKKMPVFVPSEYMDLYWSNRGKIESDKQLRLTIRYRLKEGSIDGYFYDRETYKMIPHQFGVSGENISVSENLKLIKSLLTEGRKEDARAKYEDVNDDVFNYYVDNDPSGNQKYLDWMLNNVVGRYRGRLEPSLMEMVKFFHQYQNMFIEKDINRHNLTTLDREIDDVKEKLLQKEKKKQAKKQSTKLYEDDRWLAISPKSWEASCYYGVGTKWCITMKNNPSYWGRYSKRATFIFIIDKTKTQEDPLYKVAYRIIGRSGKYELWNAPDYEISKGEDGLRYFNELPEELKERALRLHQENFPPSEGRPEWVDVDPKAQALLNELDEEDIEDVEDYWYGLSVYQVDEDYYAVGSTSEVDEAIRNYYNEYTDEDLMEYYDYEGHYLYMLDQDSFIDGEVENYTNELSEYELLEISGFDGDMETIENELSGLRDELDSLDSQEDSERIDEIEDEISTLEFSKDDLIERAKERLSDNVRKDWEYCLSDGAVNCLVNDKGWFSNARQLYNSGLVDLDRVGLLSNITDNAEYDVIGSYGYNESQDDDGNHWYIYKIDY
jgi:hypothetical protein